ncbi:MAG TPA: hypothetical protein VGP07_21520 [Polyangia bacterium]|jgi:hypothetical protein
MNVPAKGACLIGLGVFLALVARPACAADRPLLVVVEAPPALEVDAAEIRRAIGAELRSVMVAPMRTSAQAPERALIVALDRERIAMSLRVGDATPVTRSIPSPSEHAARLHAIAWLAGNLARDQVSPLFAEVASEPLPPPAGPGTDGAAPHSPLRPTLEPPRFEAPAATVTAHVEREPARPATWTLGVATGPAVSLYQTGHTLRQSTFGSWPANVCGWRPSSRRCACRWERFVVSKASIGVWMTCLEMSRAARKHLDRSDVRAT